MTYVNEEYNTAIMCFLRQHLFWYYTEASKVTCWIKSDQYAYETVIYDACETARDWDNN